MSFHLFYSFIVLHIEQRSTFLFKQSFTLLCPHEKRVLFSIQLYNHWNCMLKLLVYRILNCVTISQYQY